MVQLGIFLCDPTSRGVEKDLWSPSMSQTKFGGVELFFPYLPAAAPPRPSTCPAIGAGGSQQATAR